MLRLTYKAIKYPSRKDLCLSEEESRDRSTLVLSLQFKDRWRGYGEAPEVPESGAFIEDMIAIIEKQKHILEGYNLNDPPRFWHFLHHLVKYKPLIAAMDMAGWDLWAKISASSTRTILKVPKSGGPMTSFTIETGTAEEVENRVKAMPWPIYKLNLDDDPQKGEQALRAIKKAAPEAIIRIDPAESWSMETAQKLLPLLEELKVELIEQPFNRESLGNLEWLRQNTKIPVMADEACQEEKDVIKVIGKYDGITIKLAKLEGITTAQRMIKLIKSANKKVVLGNMGEGSIGSTAAAQFLPWADYVDLDGALRKEHVLGKGLGYDFGAMDVPYGPGLGLSFN